MDVVSAKGVAMNRMLNHMEDILNEQVSGFHQYVLDDPVHLSYVSENLCKMVGVCPEELLCEDKDLYLSLVHPADREQYRGFLRRLTQEEQTLTSEYRLITKDGAVRYVRDVFTSKKLDNGVLVGCSVLTDITDLKQENHNLRFLNETIPCGFEIYLRKAAADYLYQSKDDGNSPLPGSRGWSAG